MLTLDQVELKHGSHGPIFAGDCCAVELANLIAAGRVTVPPELLWCDRPLEPFLFEDDHPSISRVVRSFVIGLNDAWDDVTRQKLKPYAAKILCTATGDADEETRGWLAVDWLVRVHAPAFLRLAGLEEHASALESLARITDAALARSAQPTIDAAAGAAAAARAAAGDAASAAASAAALAAAGAAARDAALGAGLDAAWSAAWTAAGAAAMAAAWAASRAAAGAAAWVAARDAFAEIVPALQASALELLDDMIAVGR